MAVYKNYTALSRPFMVLGELFRLVAPALFLFMGAAGILQAESNHPWEAIASIASVLFLGLAIFLGLQWIGVAPLIVDISPTGFGVKLWFGYEQFKWDDLKAVRYHAWLNQLDMYVPKRMPVSKKFVIFNMSKQQIRDLMDDIKRYAPQVRFKRF